MDFNVSDSDDSQRKFFMHPPHKAIGVSAGFPALRARMPVSREPDGASTQLLRLGVLGFSSTPKADWVFEVLSAQLEERGHAVCDRLVPIDEDDQWSDTFWQSLDCLLIGGWAAMDRTNAEAIERFCRRGGGVVGLAVDGPSSNDRAAFDREVLGRSSKTIPGTMPIPMGVIAADTNHPIVADLGPFVSIVDRSTPTRLDAGATTLLDGLSHGRVEPIAWVRRYLGGRVFTTQLGRVEDFGEPDFLRLLGNAVCWTAGRRAS